MKKVLTEEQRKKRYEAKKRYRAKYPEKLAAEKRRRYHRIKNDPQFKIAKNVRKRLKKYLGQTEKIGSSKKMFGCTPAELREHIEKQFEEGMNWDNYGEWHIDHIKPVCAYDLTIPGEKDKVNHYSNLRPLWAGENQDKAVTDKLQSVKNKKMTEPL